MSHGHNYNILVGKLSWTIPVIFLTLVFGICYWCMLFGKCCGCCDDGLLKVIRLVNMTCQVHIFFYILLQYSTEPLFLFVCFFLNLLKLNWDVSTLSFTVLQTCFKGEPHYIPLYLLMVV